MHNTLRLDKNLEILLPKTGTKVRIKYRGNNYGNDYDSRKLDHTEIHIRILNGNGPFDAHYITVMNNDGGLGLMVNLGCPVPTMMDVKTLQTASNWIKVAETDLKTLEPILRKLFPADRLI